VRSGNSSKYKKNKYKSSLGCLRQKLIGALNSARIGKVVKPKKISKIFPQKLVKSGKSSKYEKNEYKSSLGCLRKKTIGALNSIYFDCFMAFKHLEIPLY
jgi:hypothetical protein